VLDKAENMLPDESGQRQSADVRSLALPPGIPEKLEPPHVGCYGTALGRYSLRANPAAELLTGHPRIPPNAIP
jgi:hypothetical protein